MDNSSNYLDFDNTNNLNYDPEFEPYSRGRSNTWPSNRSEALNNYHPNLAPCEEGGSASSSYQNLIPTPADDILVEQDESSDPQDDLSPQSAIKKNSSRRNAWGNHSYADLITQAIQQSPDKRLTLSQIYEWMVQNVEYFKDKGDSNSSAGWKNSIRHNLSLHNRFMRIQNDGAGKSSWWMINPEAKPGKSQRRRCSSMETKAFEKKKNRARKKEQLRQSMLASSLPSGSHNLLEHTPSPCSSISENIDQYPDSPANQLLNGGVPLTNQHVQAHQNQLHAHHTQSSNVNQNGSPVYHQLNGLQPQQSTVQQPQPPMYGAATNGNNLSNNCLLGQINSPDHQFRTRTASNASSCGRFSPLDENHVATSSLSPLANNQQQQQPQQQWANANVQPSNNSVNTNGYGQLDLNECPNELIDLGSLSITSCLNEQNLQPAANNTNGQYNNGGATSYLNSNMFIGGNPMFADERTGYISNNRSNQQHQMNKQQQQLNNMCKTPQNSINSSMNNLNNMSNLNQINNQMNQMNQLNQQAQPINDSLLEGSLLNPVNDCFGSGTLMPNGSQSIESYFNDQQDYSLDGPQLISDLNCDSNNPNDDENNNRIFSLTNLSSNSITLSNSTNQAASSQQQPQQPSNYNNSLRYDQQQRQANSYNVNSNNDRIMFNQNPNLMYQNAGGNQLSNGQHSLSSYNPLPTDLDPNLYSQTLDCDIESVIKKELSLDGSFGDFSFDPIPHSTGTSTSTSNTISNQATQSCAH